VSKTSLEDIRGPIEILYSGVKIENSMRRKYLILFFLRRTGIIISLLIPNNFIQYSVYLASNSIHLIVFLMKKPFTSTMDSITQVITDASILSL